MTCLAASGEGDADHHGLPEREILYISAPGVGKWSNLPLYGMAIAISLVGLNIGNAISKRMDQRMFSNLLLAMMFVSTILLYCASYGLTGR